jgi:hypothetical protein
MKNLQGTLLNNNSLSREPDYARKNRWAGHVVKILTGTPAGKRPSGRPRRRWEENITMDLKEMGIYMRNWVDSTQGRDYWRDLVNTALNLWVP